MNRLLKDRMEGLVKTRALFDFHIATRAIFRGLRHGTGKDEFDKNDIHDYMRSLLDLVMTEAEVEGPLTAKDYPMMDSAIAYVRRHGKGDTAARHIAAGLYDLDHEGLAILDGIL